MLAYGEVSAPDLLKVYLDWIARLDSELRCYRVVLADSAREDAEAAQELLDAGERFPLLGVPIAIKDDVDVAGENLGRTLGGSSGSSAAAFAAGLAPLALGSDGGGSIRIPSSWCGLFGVKPQRDRVSLEPHDNAWHGLSANGPITRSVLDAAIFLDPTSKVPGPDGELIAAATRAPGKLRIALSTKVPTLPVRVGFQQLAAVEQAGALLRELGHEVITGDPDYPVAQIFGNFVPRYLRGISDDADAQAHPERLEPRTRNMARGLVFLRPAHRGPARRRGAGRRQDPVDL